MTIVKHTCATCKHWKAKNIVDPGWGICGKMMTSSDVDIVTNGWDSPERVETFKTFFCAEHPGFKDDK